MATSDQYTRIEQTEHLSLDRPGRPGGLPLAAIRLGQYEGKWANAIEANQQSGDCWGFGAGLGFWNGDTSGLFPTRSEAWSAAVNRLLEKISCRPVEMAAQIAWAKSLVPQSGDQIDMFGEVA